MTVASSVKVRLIPVLLLRNGVLVRSRNFSMYQVTGEPFSQVDRLNSWRADELIYLDIARNGNFSVDQSSTVIGARSGGKRHYERPPANAYEFVQYLSKRCFMPLAYGGAIRSLEQIRLLLSAGADKVVLNTAAFDDPSLITRAAEAFGSQCVIVSLDCKKTSLGYEVHVDGGRRPTGLTAVQWAQRAQDLGAGELLVNSIDRDGTGQGYDTALYAPVVNATSIPVIICGGVGHIEHFSSGFQQIKPHALAAANIFNFLEHSYQVAKEHLLMSGVDVRPPIA